jgi:hypothetical protein
MIGDFPKSGKAAQGGKIAGREVSYHIKTWL